jgi:hypothetical protein
MSGNDPDKDLNDLIFDSKKLFGDVEELNKEELRELLNDSDEPAESVRRVAFLMMENLVKEFRLRGEYPPQRYADALNQLRPPDQLSHNPNALLQQAKKWVAGLLEGSRASSETRLQFSFQRKGELSEGDRRILEETETEVRRKMKKNNE